jgi:hypothetical protein
MEQFYKDPRTPLRMREGPLGAYVDDLARQLSEEGYRSGEDAERRLPVLSTYLGHVHVADTYWYLSACPELMGQAVARLEQHWEQRP